MGKPVVWCVYGTRPEVIKLAPVVWALRDLRSEIDVLRVFTGQHKTLARDLFQGLDMDPDLECEIMADNQPLADLSARCLTSMATLIRDGRPDAVVVQGDTATVLFTALAAFYERRPIAHVEAGLRSHDLTAPFPEEGMRRLVAPLAKWHFAPTVGARDALVSEGVDPSDVRIVGNTSVDAIQYAASHSNLVSIETRELIASMNKFVLLTIHRRENFGQPLLDILGAIAEFADAHRDTSFLLPVHPNPNVGIVVNGVLGDRSNVVLVAPLRYFDLAYAMGKASLVVTDSGGIQEEAPALGKRVVVLREVTERPEGIDAGVAVLVGSDRRRILREIEWGLSVPSMSGSDIISPYGDGRAGWRIADALASDLASRERRGVDWVAGLAAGPNSH